MNVAIDKILYHLVGNGDLQSVPAGDLRRLTSDHPYFSIGQLMLTRKLQEDKDPDLLPQTHRTALYISNPLWLRYQLQTKEFKVKLPPGAEMEEVTASAAVENISADERRFVPTVERVREIMDGITTVEEKAAVAPEIKKEVLPAETVVHNTVLAEDEVPAEIPQEKPISPAVPTAETRIDIPAEIEMVRQTPGLTSPEESQIDEDISYPQTSEEVTVQMEMDEKQKDVIANILSEQLAEFRKPVTADTELSIESEPYHTVDYFASQGIQADLNAQNQDKLSNQLRKFTDWLKPMKAVPSDTGDLGTDPELEGAIHNIANTSNEAKEIVTETMAEVLVKQGKTEKAVQLYIKLSFLNPDKSAYFAAKIQQLKGI